MRNSVILIWYIRLASLGFWNISGTY